MYLHIGNNYSLDTRDIVGIFDIENTSQLSAVTLRKRLAKGGGF